MPGSRKMAEFEDLDFISNLPNEILLTILSLLPVDEAVRTSILSKTWLSMWKNTPHLDLNVMHMIKPLTKLQISASDDQLLDYIRSLPKYYRIRRYIIIVFLILLQHRGGLKSCKFTHFPLEGIQINLALLFVRKKTVEELCLECKPLNAEKIIQRFQGSDAYGIFSSLSSLEIVNYYLESSIPFGGCMKLKTLKLKLVAVVNETLHEILGRCYELESLSLVGCSKLRKLKIFNMKLKFLELRALCVYQIIVSAASLENYRGQKFNPDADLQCPIIWKTNDVCHCVQETLKFVSIVGFTGNQREADFVKYLVAEASKMEKITIVCRRSKKEVYRGPKSDPDDDLQCPILWETNDVCHCVHETLKFVSIVGFTGNQRAADFVKHLAAEASKMEKILIVCKKSKKEVSFLVPLQDQKASSNLSIMVKIAKNKSPFIELTKLFNNKSRNCFVFKKR
ncbi:hypothetical protein K1719_034872 [Acacia pycnantha]|nr:hypothetical protein K1719_034872 [Acacia pycnantha]